MLKKQSVFSAIEFGLDFRTLENFINYPGLKGAHLTVRQRKVAILKSKWGQESAWPDRSFLIF